MNDASTLCNIHTQVSRKNFLPSEELNLVTMFVFIFSGQPNGIYFYFALIGAACSFSNANGTYPCSTKEMQHDSSSHSSCLPNYYLQNVVSFFRDTGSLKKRCQFSVIPYSTSLYTKQLHLFWKRYILLVPSKQLSTCLKQPTVFPTPVSKEKPTTSLAPTELMTQLILVFSLDSR